MGPVTTHQIEPPPPPLNAARESQLSLSVQQRRNVWEPRRHAGQLGDLGKRPGLAWWEWRPSQRGQLVGVGGRSGVWGDLGLLAPGDP